MNTSLASAAALTIAWLVLTGCASKPEPLTMQNVQTVSATVEAIDLDKRLLELRDGDQTVTVQVSPEVRNLEQVKVGDRVVVRFFEAFAAQLRKKGESETIGDVDAVAGSTRAPAGDKPGAAVGNTVTTTVVIEAVDRTDHSITFTGPTGMTRTVTVDDPQAQQFIGKLRKGDEVELTYSEALAVTVEPST